MQSPAPAHDERDCELCEAAELTERFHSDDECWIAECESCSVPMIVWRRHDPSPPDDVRRRLHDRLTSVVADRFDGDIWIDDTLRSIPAHYHAHARPRWGSTLSPIPRRTDP